MKPPLQQIRFKQAVEKVVAETREKFYFLHQNLSMLRVLITDPRQTCFAASDVTPVYGVILPNQESLLTQLATLNLTRYKTGLIYGQSNAQHRFRARSAATCCPFN